MGRFIDITGQKFGRLIVIRKTDSDKKRNSRWLCKCDCGEKVVVLGFNLQKGSTKSCGCFRNEETIRRFTRHGHSQNNITYKSWQYMKQRCMNPKHKHYHNYGGRGIRVCKRWLKFENFLKDMGECLKGYQIDRKKNGKGYCKENCRWVTRKQQMRNTRRNHLKTFNGKTQCLMKWAEEFGINFSTLRARICIYNWSMKRALMTPVRKYENRKTNG